MSSPKLNYLIIAGSLLMYFSVYVQLLYSTNKTANHIRCIVRIAFCFESFDLVDNEGTCYCRQVICVIVYNYNILQFIEGRYFFITKYDPFHAAAHLDVCAGLPPGIWYNPG